MKKTDILFALVVVILFIPFVVSEQAYAWYISFNESHGSFPYQSWGINRDPKAEFTIDFGREVMVDEVVLTLRADFPHDNYWEKVTLSFSDGSTLEANLEKTNKRQSIKFDVKKVKTITLKNLIKAKGVSEFPALTQFEAWGNELI